MIQYRPYQAALDAEIHQSWMDGHRNVMAVSGTGTGKTVVIGGVIHRHGPGCIAIAHRQELVGQISCALAANDIPHRIAAPDNVIKNIISKHESRYGRCYYNAKASTAVASVDTLMSKASAMDRWYNTVTKWIMDEGHHVLATNKWGKATLLFGDALGLAMTATPRRADGRGLGRHADGLMDTMVLGPSMRWCIEQGFLADYTVFLPPSDLDVSRVDVSSVTHDYVQKQMANAVRESTIIGDIPTTYARHATGCRGITFVPDVSIAMDVADAFNAVGIPAMALSAKTKDKIRQTAMDRLVSGDLLQIVNVGLFGEGTDVPCVEVVSMGNKTASFSKYAQEFGRALRPMDGKIAKIIDHVGNVIHHNLPDKEQVWTLDAREKRQGDGPSDAIPLRACLNVACQRAYETYHKICPHCGHYPEPTIRSGPEFVNGDLTELSPEVLAAMRADIDALDGPPKMPYNPSRVVEASVNKNHRIKQDTIRNLQECISWWGGYQRSQGRSDSESYRRFNIMFGIDVLNAQMLKTKDALILAQQITDKLGDMM